jgi:DNA-binding MarR family transcriptional regulator
MNNEIRRAQVAAGEAVVINNLEKRGLVKKPSASDSNSLLSCTDKSKEIMRLVISDTALVRDLLISEANVEWLRYIGSKKGAMTYQIAKDFGISIQSASTRLKRLYATGYLTRNQLTAEAGGIEYIYYLFE